MPYIKGLYWYDFQDDGWNSEYNEDNFGMVRADLTPKKQFFALKDISRLVGRAEFIERVDAGDPKIWILKFKSKDGKTTLALWSAYADDDYQITLKEEGDALKAPVILTCPGEGSVAREFGSRDWACQKNAPLVQDQFQITFRGSPCILEGNLAEIKAVKLERKAFPEKARPKNSVFRIPEKIAVAKRISAKEDSKAYQFGDEASYRKITEDARNGKAGIDASFSIRWDESKILLTVNVLDDVFSQDFDGEETWKGDGLQLAFQPISRNGADPELHTDFDIALTKDSPKAYRQSPNPAPEKDIETKVLRDGQRSTYAIAIPAKALGLQGFKPDSLIGFSLLVNDNDGKGRKGYLRWGDGIGHSKNPSQYNFVLLED